VTQKKKRKARRRTLSPQPRLVIVVSTEKRLRRASHVAFWLGALCLGAALATQYRLFGLPAVRDGALILKVTGISLMIAGWIFGRNARVGLR
jgi:hypothetical protein